MRLLLGLLLIAAVALSAPPRAELSYSHVCIDASALGVAGLDFAASYYLDGEGWRPAPVYVEGVVVPAVYLNITEVYTVVAPQRLSKVCLDIPPLRKAADAVVKEAEGYAKARGSLYVIKTPHGVGYLLVENRPADISPIVKWPSKAPSAEVLERREVAPRRPQEAVQATMGEVVGYIKSVVFNFTRYTGGCAVSRGRIGLPNGTVWIEVVLTNATTPGTYRAYIDIYDVPTSGVAVFYDYYGQQVTVDGRSPTYVARHVDVPTSAQSKLIYVETWICGGPSGVLDGYVLFRVKASDYYVGYVTYPIQPGAVVVVKNALASPSLNEHLADGTHLMFVPTEIPPGHWVGTGDLSADFAIRLCTTSSANPPPSYFTTNLYYGPYWLGSQGVAAQSCGQQNVGGHSLYCCSYRANSWSWINAPDQIATSYDLRTPMGLPLVLGPIPTHSVVYADVTVNMLKYQGQRRPEAAPPDSQIFGKFPSWYLYVVLDYWNARDTSGVAARIDIRVLLSGGMVGMPYMTVSVSPRVIKTGSTQYVFNLPDRLDVAFYSSIQIFVVTGSPPTGKTHVPSTSLRSALDLASAVLEVLGFVAQVLQFVAYATGAYADKAAATIPFVSTVGRFGVKNGVSTYSVSISSNTAVATINFGLLEKQTRHSIALGIFTSAGTYMINTVTVWEGSSTKTFAVGASMQVSDRLRLANVPYYGFRNFFCGFNEVPDEMRTGICNYDSLR